MTEIDRVHVLEDLDLRHDDVLQELAVLEQHIERVLGAMRPAPIDGGSIVERSPPAIKVAGLVDRPQQPQAKRRAQRHAQ
jgi:hypothetical protein